MESDALIHTGVNNCLYHLQQYLLQADLPGVVVAIGDE